jgi:DNA helicase IV
MELFNKFDKEQAEGESEILSYLKEGAEFESQLTEHRNELLFKLSTEIENTAGNLERAEQLVSKFKKHLKQLQELQRVLSK